ncbi:MAG: response regulator [Firmicutes bacterium]|nr:response regulator [Bacillota bacterium]
MGRLEAMIVDDELPAREELNFLLSESFNDNINVICEAKNGIEAINKIKSFKPKVVFLDIDIPCLDGLKVAQIAIENNPKINIVFVTAYDQYALKAFEINALDYLVKPIDLERLKKTVSRIIDNDSYHLDYTSKLEKVMDELEHLNHKEELKCIPCKENGKIILVKRHNIYYCTVENGNTYIGIKNKTLETFYTLKELENKLNFFRAHRSYLVNIDNIKLVEPLFHGTYSLVLNDSFETKIPVSRINSKKLRDIFEL